MEQVTEAMKAHHKQLAERLERDAQALAEGGTDINPKELVEFLENDLLPHARGEELTLYPLMDALVRDYGRATATMSIDHEYIGNYVNEIRETASALANAPASDKVTLRKRLARLVLSLQALFLVHQAKEERVYLPLLDEHVPPEEQQDMLARMHEA